VFHTRDSRSHPSDPRNQRNGDRIKNVTVNRLIKQAAENERNMWKETRHEFTDSMQHSPS
jgi:hypothetical protein